MLAAPSLLFLIGWSRYWRGLAAGARGSGLRVAPGWERGAPPLGQKESLPDAAGALGAVSLDTSKRDACVPACWLSSVSDACLLWAHWVLWHLHEGPKGERNVEKARPYLTRFLVGTEAKTQFHPPRSSSPRRVSFWTSSLKNRIATINLPLSLCVSEYNFKTLLLLSKERGRLKKKKKKVKKAHIRVDHCSIYQESIDTVVALTLTAPQHFFSFFSQFLKTDWISALLHALKKAEKKKRKNTASNTR